MILPVLETKRLILRPVEPKDAEGLFDIRRDPEQMKYIPRPVMQQPEEAEKMISDILKGVEENTLLNWTIVLKETQAFLGIFGYYRLQPEHFRAEIGYLLHPSYQGKGFMNEALRAIIDYGFAELSLHTIEAVIDPDNRASEKVLQKLGFVKEAHFRENGFFDGRFWDAVHYTLFKPQ